MQITFDPVKDASNLEKHGVPLALALDFEYGELRLIALAPLTEILYCVVFVDRDPVRRIISLRRTNRREVKHYVQS